jgi:hypothetical protein
MVVVVGLVLQLGVVGCDKSGTQEAETEQRLDVNVELATELSRQLTTSILAGGDFMVRMQNEDGSFRYKYLPDKDRFDTANNILRHTGVVYSLLLLYEFSSRPAWLESAKSGAAFMLENIERIDEDIAYVFFNKKAKLGGAALAVIALCKLETLNPTGEYHDIIKDLTNFILFMQEDTGQFTSFYIYMDEIASPKDSQIYPGEAMLALVRAYQLLEDERYLAALDDAVAYYREAFPARPRAAFTTWTMTAMNELYAIRPEEVYSEFAFGMADWLVEQQYTEDAPKPEYVGGYRPNVPTIAAASRTEGVCDAYALARDLGDETRAAHYEKSMLLASSFLRRLQFNRENTRDFPRPKVPRGAFFGKLGTTVARIDYTQHSISAMIKTLTFLPPERIDVERYGQM